jgi:hypothetical protein
MARDGDILEVKKVLSEHLKGFKPEIHIERSPTTEYLHVWVISDAFKKYPEMKRMSIIGEIFEKAWAEDTTCPQITRLFPLTHAEFADSENPQPLATLEATSSESVQTPSNI